MPKLGFALPGAAALALGVLTATTPVVAQQAGTAPPQATSPSSSRDTASPGRQNSGQTDRDRREFGRRDEDEDRPRARRPREDDDDWRGHRMMGERRGMMGEQRGMMGEHRAMMGPRMMERLCGPRGERVMSFMLDRLERITQPTDAQKPAFDKLKEAAARARETIQQACPDGPRPVTPPGRLAAAERHLEAMLAGVRLLRPPLEEYYGSLSEEQKARLYMHQGRRWRERDDWRDRRGWHRYERHHHHHGWRDRDEDDDRRGWRRDDDDRGSLRGRDRDEDRPGGRRGERDRDGYDGSDDTGSAPARERDDRDSDGWPDDWRGRS
ncbi:MAG TPA: Spy/CpxP family protein refolding chaperone [Xanthobacteraceae bacterium]|nr:Spy/CpxP family protein refolding chaperone [Xanthobacteraceae bacterium]